MFIFLDTETTVARADDRLCHLVFKTEDGVTANELFNAGRKISIEAVSTHHITNQMVQGNPKFKDSGVYK